MVTPPTSPPRFGRLGDHINAAHHRRFVGRNAELDLFRRTVLAHDRPFAVLHVHGAGGIGKTALLREYARIADQLGWPVIRLDGRDLDPSPSGFLFGLARALGHEDGSSAIAALGAYAGGVLLIDTYESLSPLDTWLREQFLPQLPASLLVVIAGRNQPAPAWRTDVGWDDIVHIMALRNLRPEESRDYLSAKGVPETLHTSALAFTHGHPLALALVTDVLARSDAQSSFLPEAAPDVVQALIERFVRQVPSDRHRDALEVCAHSRITTEALLADVLDEEQAPALFAWLRGLSFIEQGPQGLFPHDLAREVLDADLRWRNPTAYRELHRRVRQHIVRRLQEAGGHDQQRAAFDLLYLHRGNPVVRAIHNWADLQAGYAESATPADIPAILSLVDRHEGAASAQIASYWAERRLHEFTVCRDASGDVSGFVAAFRLDRATVEASQADPAMAAAWRFAARHGPARPGDTFVYHRFTMGRDTYQTASAATNLMSMTGILHCMTTPRLAWNFLAVADPEFWHLMFTHIRFRRSPEAEFTVDGRHFAVYTHDWRAEPAPLWIELMAEVEMSTELSSVNAAPRPTPLVLLSEPEFAAAIRQALRDYTRPDALCSNPLLRSHLVRDRTAQTDPVRVLQARLREAADQLRNHPRDEKLYRAIHRTYLEPVASQELAAERLGLPFSTYRRHLTTGVARVTDWLWLRETDGPAS